MKTAIGYDRKVFSFACLTLIFLAVANPLCADPVIKERNICSC